jgi:hypothetical protein
MLSFMSSPFEVEGGAAEGPVAWHSVAVTVGDAVRRGMKAR